MLNSLSPDDRGTFVQPDPLPVNVQNHRRAIMRPADHSKECPSGPADDQRGLLVNVTVLPGSIASVMTG